MGPRRQGKVQVVCLRYRRERQLRPGIPGAEGPRTRTGLRNPPGVDANEPEAGDQAEERKKQAGAQTSSRYPVGTDA